MLAVCVIAIFELAIIIGLLVASMMFAKKQIADFWLRWAVLIAHIKDGNAGVGKLKEDIDAKFGPDLIEKLNAIFKVGAAPHELVIGADGKPHKVNRDY